MIVVDASALVAVLLREPEDMAFRRLMVRETDLLLSPVGYWEAATRLRALRDEAGVADLDHLIASLGIRIVPATSRTASLASKAERNFGKRTSARLNLGDCFAYALAKESNAPLLFKGDDFSQTDLIPALPT